VVSSTTLISLVQYGTTSREYDVFHYSLCYSCCIHIHTSFISRPDIKIEHDKTKN